MKKSYFINFLKVSLTVFFSVLIITAVARAATVKITPPAGTPVATFYSLSEIYNFITNNTTATVGDPALDFTGALEDSGYTLTEIYTALANLIVPAQVKLGATYLGQAGTLVPSGGTATVADVLIGKTFFGDSQADWNLQTGTYDASNLSTATVKKGTTFGVASTGAYSGYPGSGWTGGTTITQAACDAQNPTWYWFEDGNGDGDTTDPEDGICVKATTVSGSWNGATHIYGNSITNQAATAGTANSVTKDSAGWTVDQHINKVAKFTAGTAKDCWGVIKSNTADTITVYGSWLSSTYASDCGTPDATSVFSISNNSFHYDNTWIGDWTCTGSFPNGTVSYGSYPTTAQVGASNVALAVADCYDGVRDLLPAELDRAVGTATATRATDTTITASAALVSWPVNGWVSQKVLITGGTGAGGYGRIESNTANVLTVDSWTGGTPDVGSTFAIIYILPNYGDRTRGNNGPLKPETLNSWKGTKLPTHRDFFGYCGYKDGGSNYENSTSVYSADKAYGGYGGQIGRTDEFLDIAGTGDEWLSEQVYSNFAQVAGNVACSYVNFNVVSNSYRFRAVFRP